MSRKAAFAGLGIRTLLLTIAATLLLSAQTRAEFPAPEFDALRYPSGVPGQAADLLRSRDALHPNPEGRVYVVLRSHGRMIAETWAEGISWRHAVMNSIVSMLRADPGREKLVDSIELCLPYDFETLELAAGRAALSNVHRGLRGLEIRFGEVTESHCPTALIARNRSFARVEKLFQSAHHVDPKLYALNVRVRRFKAYQFLLLLKEQPRVLPMHRGNTVVAMADVTSKGVHELANGMVAWLTGNVHPDGRMTYKYFPSRGRESASNNMIRQFMASLCLVRVGNEWPNEHVTELAQRNVRYNFDRFFYREGRLGRITFRGKSKLGAASLAALAIVESPFREQFSGHERALRNLTEHLQQPDGSFHTFYGSTRRDNQNFYPGETLLLWSELYSRNRDPMLLERFMRSFHYYRVWHRSHRNPAFVPWHTQAYYRVWRITKNPELRNFIFEMNDWILGMQQWQSARYPDMKGRFYDPDRPRYGPPHASSTGVYLEGLIDAYRLAKDVGDESRAKLYRRAILRGLRSLMQLQFVDDVDMFYISRVKAVRGGLRTTVYDNTIRVDNIQHGLMAILRILTTFDAEGPW